MTDIFGGNGKYGDLDLSGSKIINCLDPYEDHHVATKQYVDSNFISKSKYKMSTDLDMNSYAVINSVSPIEENDLTTKKYVDDNFINNTDGRMLGDLDMNRYYILNIGYPSEMSDVTTKEYVYNNFVSKLDGRMTGDIDMGRYIVKNSGTPFFPNDLTTKEYVDNIKLYEGYIPNLETNVSKTGFITSASSEYSILYSASNAFNNNLFGWVSASQSNNFWIDIECPTSIRIWGFRLGGDGTSNWTFDGSNDHNTWFTLYTATNEVLRISPITYKIINNSSYYKYYRFFSLQANVSTIEIRHMQIFRFLV